MPIDDQDIFNLDISQLVNTILMPIERTRSQTVNDGFLESRLNAFYRMIGFPVVKSETEYYSPGYDPDLNVCSTLKEKRDNIESNITVKLKVLDDRESIFKTFSNIFSNGGVSAQSHALGSLFVRSFDHQFGSAGPLEQDKSQNQIVKERISIQDVFNTENETIVINTFSNHPLKPFIVDPRIGIYPDKNTMAAPFLQNSFKLQCFAGSSYTRPYIEKVISSRLNNKNYTNINITKIVEDIKKSTNITDSYLIDVGNSDGNMTRGSDADTFNNFFKLMRALIKILVKEIKELNIVRSRMNFIPTPDPKFGLEGNMSVGAIINNNKNNAPFENEIINLSNKKILKSFCPEAGIQKANISYAFDEISDIVNPADKINSSSDGEQLNKLIEARNNLGNVGLQSLKNIEYIMGEFSGLGLIDIVAMQSAFFLMDRSKLLGLIDMAAYERLKAYREDLNSSGIERTEDILGALTEYETKIKEVYTLIQLYFNQVFSGKASIGE